jgi:uncharacterized protein (DUF58 family)
MKWRELLRRQRIMRAGWAYIGTVLLTAIAAFISANNLLFLILAAMLSALLLSGVIGRLGLSDLELDVRLPEHTFARREVAATVGVRNLKAWIPSLSITLVGSRTPGSVPTPLVYFPLIPGGASLEEPTRLYFARRGVHTTRDFQFTTRFPFGFVERREDVRIQHEVIVYPSLDPTSALADLLAALTSKVIAWQRGQSGEFHQVRPYQVGESARHLDWKATAHSGTPQIREFTADADPTVLLVLDLATVPGPWFESAIEATAYLAWELTTRRIPLRLAMQGFDVTSPDSGDVYTILRHLALVETTQGRPPLVAALHPFVVVLTERPQRFRPEEWPSNDSANTYILGPFGPGDAIGLCPSFDLRPR